MEEEVDGEWREVERLKEEDSDAKWRERMQAGRWREEESETEKREEEERNIERRRRRHGEHMWKTIMEDDDWEDEEEGRSVRDRKIKMRRRRGHGDHMWKNIVGYDDWEEEEEDEDNGRPTKERRRREEASQNKSKSVVKESPEEDEKENTEKEVKTNANITCTGKGCVCGDGLSIDISKLCDTIDDCSEGEDEKVDCEARICHSKYTKCDDGKCVPQDYFCDTVEHCHDGSDEKNCSYRTCVIGHEFVCDNGDCVRPINICDGVDDCGDGSDERDCNENSDYKQCKSGKKIHRHYWCDGWPSCSHIDGAYVDDTDEMECPKLCMDGAFECNSGRCVPAARKCDGHCDCLDCEDERNLNCSNFYTSHSGVAKCKQNVTAACPVSNPLYASCIREEYICDGVVQCRSRGYNEESGCKDTDKSVCKDNGFRCPGHQCIPQKLVCDGVMNCLHGDDEKDCPEVVCKEGQWRCEGGGVRCINITNKCDSKYDCPDRSDEMFCEEHQCSSGQVKCRSGQCVKEEFWCDHFEHCFDGSDEDEETCATKYAAECEKGDVFRCKDGKQCIPMEHHCLSVKRGGCVDESHLVNCSDKVCPEGAHKCRSGPCVPAGNCTMPSRCPDSWDDSDGCPFNCSEIAKNCSCLDITADCSNLQLYVVPDVGHRMKKMDLSYNRLGPFLAHNTITSSGTTKLTSLNLSSNGIHELGTSVFKEMLYLKTLDLSNNELTIIRSHAFDGLSLLSDLKLRGNKIQTLEAYAFSSIRFVIQLDLSHQQISHIDKNAFSGLIKLDILDLTDNPIDQPDERVFNKTRARVLKYVKTDKMSVCCTAKGHNISCLPPVDDFSSCEDLMKNGLLRSAIWLIGFVAIVGNLTVILCHSLSTKISNSVFPFLVINLGFGDLVMGVYLMILAVADIRYRGEYAKHAYDWKRSGWCQLAGFLSTLSSELSVFTLTVITIERLMIVVKPFYKHIRDITKTKRNYWLVMLGVWTVAILLAALPLFSIPYFSGFYSRSGVCLALHITQDTPNGWEYSVFVFMVLNFLSFTVIAVSQALMYKKVQNGQKQGPRQHYGGQHTSQSSSAQCSASRHSRGQHSSNKRTRTILTVIVATDAACWLPIICLGVLSLCGVSAGPEAFTWIAVFILPVNSALNPIIYTFIDKKLQERVVGLRKTLTFNSTTLTAASRFTSTFRIRKSSGTSPGKSRYKDVVCVYTPNKSSPVTHHLVEQQRQTEVVAADS